MKNIYEKIGVDAINCLKEGGSSSSWKYSVVFFMTMSNCFNFLLLMWILIPLGIRMPSIEISLFGSKQLNSLCWFMIELFLPFGILNYLLFFWRDRYKKLIIRYGKIKKMGRLILSYVILSAFLYLSIVLFGYFYLK